MHANTSSGPAPASAPWLRFGRESDFADGPAAGERTVVWQLRRNCSLAPRQLFAAYLSLCAVSLGIAGMFWWQGARLVLPFASAELLALGVALLCYARHATDGESIRLAAGRLTVEQRIGSRAQKVEFVPAWVRIEPEFGDRSLVELSGQGRRVVVGRHVRPELRRQLADELRWAVRRRDAAQGR